MTEYGRLSIHPGGKVIGEQVAKPALEAGFIFILNRFWDGKDTMNTYLSLITDRIGKISIIFGIAFLLVGLALSMVLIPGEAAEVNGQGNCDTGWVKKDETWPFGYNGPDTIIKVIVKSGNSCFPQTIANPNDGCYQATGLKDHS